MMNKLIEALDAEFERQRKEQCGALHLGGRGDKIELDGTVNMRALIHAILTALREPSEAMLAAGEKLHPMGLEENSMREYLHAMLDEAMK